MKTQQNPFPGLRPFRQEEDHLFFGREEQTMELLQTLGNHRFVAVVGTSGSGKSSLVRCGLLSQILGGKMLQAGTVWEVAVTHPGADPMSHLADALLQADVYDADEEDAKSRLLATLGRSHFGLVESIRQAQLGEGTNFLLVVDQFEEIFRFNRSGAAERERASEFVSMLLQAAQQSEVPIYIVLTMRSDFIGDCAEFEELAEAVNRGEYLIPRMTRDQFKQSIEGPIRVAGGEIAPRLLQRLLNDLGQQADQLPCLQHALMRTWDRAASLRPGEPLDLEDYDAIGRMQEALSRHADEIYAGLASQRERDLCEGMFRAITLRESENRGIRRPQRLDQIARILDVEIDELTPIVEAYRRHGVTFLMPPFEVLLNEDTVIDISHESLMRVWVRLREWVEKEAESVGIFHRIAESAGLYAKGKAGLYRHPELGIALSWREATQPNGAWADQYDGKVDQSMAYLSESQEAAEREEAEREAARQRELAQAKVLVDEQRLRAEEQRRSAERMRVLGAVACFVAVIALIASIYAMKARRQAKANEVRALANAETAKENEVRAEANALEAEVQTRSAIAAKETLREELYIADMGRTLHAYESTDNEELIELLARQIPNPDEADLRGIEWRMWWGAANRHVDALNDQFTSGLIPGDHVGEWIVQSVYPGAISLYRASDRRLIKSFRLYSEMPDPPQVLSEYFASPHVTPDGLWLVAAFDDGKIRRWRMSDWERVPPDLDVFQPNPADVSPSNEGDLVIWTTRLSADGSQLLTLDSDKLFSFYDLQNWEFERSIQFSAMSDEVRSFSVSPEFETLIVADEGTDGVGRLWGSRAPFETVELVFQFPAAKICAIRHHPNGRWIVVLTGDNVVRFLDAETYEEIESMALDGGSELLYRFRLSKHGSLLVARLEGSNAVKVWNLETRTLVSRINGHSRALYGMQFVGEEPMLWTSGKGVWLRFGIPTTPV